MWWLFFVQAVLYDIDLETDFMSFPPFFPFLSPSLSFFLSFNVGLTNSLKFKQNVYFKNSRLSVSKFSLKCNGMLVFNHYISFSEMLALVHWLYFPYLIVKIENLTQKRLNPKYWKFQIFKFNTQKKELEIASKLAVYR